jgi:hypothetical protein
VCAVDDQRTQPVKSVVDDRHVENHATQAAGLYPLQAVEHERPAGTPTTTGGFEIFRILFKKMEYMQQDRRVLRGGHTGRPRCKFIVVQAVPPVKLVHGPDDCDGIGLVLPPV